MLDSLRLVPRDPLFQLLAEYQQDQRTEKVNLGIGIYRDSEGHPFVFPSVQRAVAELDVNNFEYPPIRGSAEFLDLVPQLFFPTADVNAMAKQATCGGTHACRMFADLVKRDHQEPTLLVGEPTWSNHFAVFPGFTVQRFSHLDEQGQFFLQEYLEALQSAEEGSVLLLHGGGTHNPSGMNASLQQLDLLIPLLKEKHIQVFVDWAYAGMGLGMADDCAWVARLWNGLENIAVGVSFSKNASLYEHRCGALFVKTQQPEVIESHLQQLSREMVSMAPGFGQEVMSWVLEHAQQDWLDELEALRLEVLKRKKALLEYLPEDWDDALGESQGLFALLPFSPEQIEVLKNQHAIYLPKNGRINFGGLRAQDVERVGKALFSLVTPLE